MAGDVLIRVRHVGLNNDRISMLRFGFHTGYVRPGNMRFTRFDLDGACTDDRFSEDFLLDLIFTAPLDEQGYRDVHFACVCVCLWVWFQR